MQDFTVAAMTEAMTAHINSNQDIFPDTPMGFALRAVKHWNTANRCAGDILRFADDLEYVESLKEDNRDFRASAAENAAIALDPEMWE